MTFGELRYAARKLVLKLDPDTARKRKEAARREAHVRRFREDSGNAGMVARELPSDEVLASWQHVEQRALDLRAAGVPGTLQDLRVRAYLDLLQERDSRAAPAAPAGPAASGRAGPDQPAPDQPAPDQPPPDAGPPGPSGTGPDGPGSGPDDPDGPDGPDGSDGPDGPDDPGGSDGPGSGPDGPGGNGGPGGPGPAPRPGPDAGPSLAALVTITIPLTTYQGRSDTPGEAAGFGPLDGDDARDLAAAAARHPRTRWCITALNPDGTAAAHACLPGRHPPPGAGPPGSRTTRHRATRPAPAPRHRTILHRPPGHPVHPADPRHPRSLRPRPRPGRLPPHPHPGPPGPRPQRHLHRAGLRPSRRPLRPGPHHRMG